MKTALTLLTALLLAQLAVSADALSQKTCQITNGTLTATISARDAGAVCSLVYDGMEFVNDTDHGRQLQVAWFYNDLDEKYNPTEAGSDSDGKGLRSSSQLLSVKADGNTLLTQSHPAFWRNLAVPELHRSNTAVATNDTLTKKLTLGHDGDPHVIVFDTSVAISPALTGPPVSSMRIEAPTLYSNPTLSRHYLLDAASEELKEVASLAPKPNQLNEVIQRVVRHDLIPILSTPDGRHAVALFSPKHESFWAYYTHDVPSDDPTNACGKITAFFKHPAEAGRSYSYRTYIFVGDLTTIKASVRKLLTHANTRPPPPSKQ